MLRDLSSFVIERRPLGQRWCLLSLTFVLTATSWCCSLNHPGEAPSRGELYYPIAVTLPPVQEDEADTGVSPRYLFVANANFDLRYNSGSLQAFDLDHVVKKINSCVANEEKCRSSIKCKKGSDENDSESPDECDDDYEKFADCDPYKPCVINSEKALEDEVLIGSFAATAVFSPSGKRLYVPTRSNTSLTYVDVDPDASGDAVLSCDQDSNRKCGDAFIRGDEEIASERDIEITGESVGAVAARLNQLAFNAPNNAGDNIGIDGIFVAQRNGTVSFFVSPDKKPKKENAKYKGLNRGPNFIHTIDGLQNDITNISLDPLSGQAYLTSQEYGTTGGTKSLQRVGFIYDNIDVKTSFIFDAGYVLLRGVSLERDTRAIGFSPLAEDKAFIVSRTPDALLILDFANARTGALEATVHKTVKVGSSASRLALGQIGSDPRLFAFVSCFGSRELYVIDVDLAEPVAVIQGFSGPFEVAVDRWRKLAYVADFRSSIIRIVDLQPIVCASESSNTECPDIYVGATDPIPCKCFDRPSRIIATLGEPQPPEELI